MKVVILTDSKVLFWMIIIAGFLAAFLVLFFALLYISNKETYAEITRLKKQLAHNESEIVGLKLTAFFSGAKINEHKEKQNEL